MSKRVFRFFWLFMTSQEQWLNKMADDGYRLLGTTTAHYEFEECEKGKYQYCVVYVANYSKEHVEEYIKSLSSYGYRVIYKNLNMDYSTGKVEIRPSAEEGGRIATEETTLHKELLIIEKEKDGTEFKLCPTFEQRYNAYSKLRMWGIVGFIVSAVLCVVGKSVLWAVIASLPLVWTILFQLEIMKLKKKTKK